MTLKIASSLSPVLLHFHFRCRTTLFIQIKSECGILVFNESLLAQVLIYGPVEVKAPFPARTTLQLSLHLQPPKAIIKESDRPEPLW